LTTTERSEIPSSKAAEDTTTIRISKSLADRVTRRLGNTDFKSVDEYVNYIVEQVLTDLEGTTPSTQGTEQTAYSKEDQAVVEQRLRDLGYL
jgi:Arc/MetJ-type ribon-helix-helix transcriptional regulator